MTNVEISYLCYKGGKLDILTIEYPPAKISTVFVK